MRPGLALLLGCCCGALPDDAAKWPWPHRGDVRAVITVAPTELSTAAAAGGPLAAVVQWRRRDAPGAQRSAELLAASPVTVPRAVAAPRTAPPLLTASVGEAAFLHAVPPEGAIGPVQELSCGGPVTLLAFGQQYAKDAELLAAVRLGAW